MKKKFNFSKRIIAALLTLAMLLSAASSLLVFGASAEESEETKGQMTDGKVVANNYDLTEAEKKLLSSGFLVGDTYGYEVPGTSDDLISVNTDDKTVTAKSFEGTKGFVWNPVYAEVVVNNAVVETIKFSDNKASYTTDAAAFSVKVKYTVEREIDADLQELLLNAPADLKHDVEMLDKLLLKGAIDELPERERKIIVLRYFRDMTQSEVAEKIGVSQVQVSRIENKIIKEFQKKLIG